VKEGLVIHVLALSIKNAIIKSLGPRYVHFAKEIWMNIKDFQRSIEDTFIKMDLKVMLPFIMRLKTKTIF
jgi:hypothetical protein